MKGVLVLSTEYWYCVPVMESSHGKEEGEEGEEGEEREENKWHACLSSFSRTAKLKREV